MVGKMTKKGLPKPVATAIATKSLQRQGVLKKGSTELTAKGERVNSFLTPNAVAGMGRKKKKSTSTKKTTKKRTPISKGRKVNVPTKKGTQKKKTSKSKK
jgi:hypothetical protein